jgi:uncharacterized protein YjeT (DUF2065 family)
MEFSGNVLWIAAGLMLIFEGLFPFISPKGWRERMTQVLSLQDGQIRFFGLVCVLLGLLLIWWLG